MCETSKWPLLNIFKRYTITWYFKGADSQKIPLSGTGKHRRVTVKSAYDVGEYSCEFYEAGKPQNIKKMIMPVTSDVGPQPHPGIGASVSTSISSSISDSISGGGIGSITHSVPSNHLDKEIIDVHNSIGSSISSSDSISGGGIGSITHSVPSNNLYQRIDDINR